MIQAENLANHPAVFHHVALMPDCHQGFGMPIGGVIACDNAVIPNAVGVDIGCGMCAVKTNIPAENIPEKNVFRALIYEIKKFIPVGAGKHHKKTQKWNRFDEDYSKKGWFSNHLWELARKSLGTLGGGNHFIEIQKGDDGFLWLMLHSGSRFLGYKIAEFYHKLALESNKNEKVKLPSDELAFFRADSSNGKNYINDMNFALEFAKENRARMLIVFKSIFADFFKNVTFQNEINIHHNYAAQESHFSKNVWVHRKGATSAKNGEFGIIPGSMGTPSYIVRGKGNPNSFCSCSHGAGRVMSRMKASKILSPDECDKAMGDIVYDRWKKSRHKKTKGLYDLGEAPQAYKNIDDVISAQLDLIEPIVKLHPLAVVKG